MRKESKLFFAVCCSLALLSANAGADPLSSYRWLFRSLPKVKELKPEQVDLGRRLFLDPVLSLEKDISCNSCHNLRTFGVDNKPTSTGHNGQLGKRNSPSVFNAGLQFAQFWDGRAKDLEEQALGPILNPVEMAMPDAKHVVARLMQDKSYVEAFEKAFPGDKVPLSFENIGKAITAFEKTLLSPSRFDRFLDGEENALEGKEKKGLETFVSIGCATCHNGVGIGGSMFQKIGLVEEYPTQDLGRFEVTKNDADKYFFKVPSLRNVDKTAPYFHDGRVASLSEAVKLMAKHQLGRELSEEQTEEILAFLKSLTADKREEGKDG